MIRYFTTQPLPPYTLTRFSGFFGPHMSEFVAARIIAHERKFALMRQKQTNKEWLVISELFTKFFTILRDMVW